MKQILVEQDVHEVTHTTTSVIREAGRKLVRVVETAYTNVET